MITVRPYSAEPAFRVFQHLDDWDFAEAEAMQGAGADRLTLFAEWHALQGAFFASWVFSSNRAGLPFAVCGAAHAGMGGVASAAFLARSHDVYRREIAAAALWLREAMGGVAAMHGIRRIEARSLAAHPTAGRFLTHLGFRHEARMPGFGPAGDQDFNLYAWTKGSPDV